jgi:hypothetical protein
MLLFLVTPGGFRQKCILRTRLPLALPGSNLEFSSPLQLGNSIVEPGGGYRSL